MTAMLTKAIWARSEQRGAALLLLLALASFANRQGLAWPRIATLARRARMSRRYVTSLLRLLAEAGEIEIDPLPFDRRRSRYRLVAFAPDPPASNQPESSPPENPARRSAHPADPIRAEWEAIARRPEPETFEITDRLEQLAGKLPAELPERSRWQAELLQLDGELEQIEADLARTEEALLEQLRQQLGNSELAQLQQQVAAGLQQLKHRLSAEEYQRQQERLLAEKIRRRFRLPELSLFGRDINPGASR